MIENSKRHSETQLKWIPTGILTIRDPHRLVLQNNALRDNHNFSDAPVWVPPRRQTRKVSFMVKTTNKSGELADVIALCIIAAGQVYTWPLNLQTST